MGAVDTAGTGGGVRDCIPGYEFWLWTLLGRQLPAIALMNVGKEECKGDD